MIEGAEAHGSLRPGMRVVEYTGGSAGSSLALVCVIKGLSVRAGFVGWVCERKAADHADFRRGLADYFFGKRATHSRAVPHHD